MTNLETDSFNKNYYCISQKALQNLEGEMKINLTEWYETGEKIQDIWKDFRESCRESIMSYSIKKEEFIGKEK